MGPAPAALAAADPGADRRGLVPYGLLGLGYLALVRLGVAAPPPGDLPSAGDGLLVGWIGNAAFAGYGLALLAAARWYWHATRAGRVTGGR